MDTLIPLGNDGTPRIVIGHNVSYDRIRVSEEYRLERSSTRYMDTMSLHIAYSGMTSSQRIMKQGEAKIEEESRPKWFERTSANSLSDVYKFYCKPEKKLEKDVRDSFVKWTLEQLKQDIPTLLHYCAADVQATLQVAKVLIPKFLKACPHPATLSGLLTMSTSYLPTNNCWDRYVVFLWK